MTEIRSTTAARRADSDRRAPRRPIPSTTLSVATALYIRVACATVRWREVDGAALTEEQVRRRFPAPYILAVWHDRLVYPAWRFRRDRGATLVSPHADGALIAETVERLGLQAVRGGRTGADPRATERLLAVLGAGRSVAITPDGPVGPRHRARRGAIYLASRSGAPVVPFAWRCRPCIEARSWDHLLAPLPFGRGVVAFGEPFRVPPDRSRAELEPYQTRLQRELAAVTALVDESVLGGSRP